jgi:hypothetical protein
LPGWTIRPAFFIGKDYAMTPELDLIWGAKKIGDTLGVPQHRISRLFEKGQLPFVKRVGKMLVADRNEMRKHFLAGGVAA